MIMIEHKGLQATWTFTIGKWISTDKTFAKMLNESMPDEDDISPSMPFRVGGLDKIVLDGAKKMFGKVLNVVAFVPEPVPEEIEGIVY